MSQEQYSDEISLRDVVLVGRDYVRELWNKKLWFVLGILLLGGYFAFKAWTAPRVFKSERQFYVESDNSGPSMGGLGGLLGTLGVGASKENPWKVIQVSNSKLIIVDVLFSKIDSSELLINKILDVYDLRNEWAKDEDTQPFLNVNFTHNEISKFNAFEKSALKRVINLMLLAGPDGAAPLRKLSLDDEWGHFEINSNTIDRKLTKAIDELTYDVTRNYFEEKSIYTYKTTRDLLKNKADSVEVLLKRKLYQLANYNDANRAIVSETTRVPGEILQQEALAFSMAHSEIRKAFEMADFNYQSKKPTFRLLDKTIPPLPSEKPSWVTALIKGSVLATILLMALFIALKLYRDIMTSVDENEA